jgi:hypothetical protein
MIQPGGLHPSSSRLLLDSFRAAEAKAQSHEGPVPNACPPIPPIPFAHLGPTTLYVGPGALMYSKVVTSTLSAFA